MATACAHLGYKGALTSQNAPSSSLHALQVVYPGAYRCVCVQIKLHHMAVNATAQAGVLGEMEGAALMDKVLKQLVTNWLADATQNNNR